MATTNNRSMHATPSLLGIPPELRNSIYRLALYHDEGCGTIAPVAAVTRPRPHVLERNHRMWPSFDAEGSVQENTTRKFHFTCVKVSGEAKAIAINTTEVGEIKDIATILPLDDISDAAAEDEEAGITGHVCRNTCLLQPPLTRVCQSMRAESLPVFYGINDFHLEASAFSFAGAEPRMAGKWWQAIGDTNLRSIRSLQL